MREIEYDQFLVILREGIDLIDHVANGLPVGALEALDGADERVVTRTEDTFADHWPDVKVPCTCRKLTGAVESLCARIGLGGELGL